MQKIHATIVGQGLGPKCNRKFRGPFGIAVNATPGVAFTATDTITH